VPAASRDVRCSPECYEHPASGSSVRQAHPDLAVSDGNDGLYRMPSAAHFRVRFRPLMSSAPPSECSSSSPRPSLAARTPSLGLRPSSRHQPAATMDRDSGSRPSSVHGVSHALDVFAPPALRVCFTPLPRTGFTYRGFASRKAGDPSSASRALSSLESLRCRRLPAGATSRNPALRALLLARIRRCRDGV